MNAREDLARHLVALELPHPAAELVLLLWQASQFFDDVADGDPIERGELHQAMWNLLIGIHSNAFWMAHSRHMLPLLESVFLRWVASDEVELEKRADARSFGWRAGFYDLVLAVARLALGPEVAIKKAAAILSLYGEPFESYMKEHSNA